MQSQIRKHFDHSTSTYRANATIQARVAENCAGRIPEINYPLVLELGAGGGLLTEYCLKKIAPLKHYFTLDLSLEMLKLTAQDKVFAVQGDGENPPFREQSFDLLVSSSAMQWYSCGADSILANISLLKDEGYFSLAFFVRGTFDEMSHISSLTGFASIYPLPEEYQCIKTLSQTGLNLETHIETYTVYFPDVASFLKSHKKTGATFTRKGSGFGKKKYADFCKKYQEIYGGEKGIPVSYRVLYMWGQKLKIRLKP
ncbi:MAG: methyltransferase domain-containing protein [Desulfonatronovibrio sp. MSAO_Bac4]|nr:MAG: methyltransferase domain-containing protein [Desulfonatronovibrio sp. MSAO_Bac4]